MEVKRKTENSNKKQGSVKVRVAKKGKNPVSSRHSKFSPSWVVVHSKDAPGFKMELIDRIREGVKKSDWKQLIQYTDSTEKEFEHILPASISSMQKKAIYGKETSERIYELARLFGLGYEVFDSKEDFKKWLMTPSKTLGNKIPFELLDSSIGFEMVENEIIRIQYNVYS
ncbi:antitoxin Xre/MbcA/ParS toxin-binding domain-containing protein [Winogradskyella schleiferi]|uniref:antitoxin Xre/MbcA/ParS toxin-binding domain-containing protein n=1 Tax=Winogradskyella schleiferi TaxID=2686078 RepID=UPI0015BF26DE|nr:antitoxin Xre/MbcA/ParS toxin-binding domain-containing protein [Winogradskyella schleiferi]